MLFVAADFDGDGRISKQDMQLAVNAISRHELSLEEVDFIADKVSDNHTV